MTSLDTSILMHIYTTYILLILMGYNIYLLYSKNSFENISKKIRLILPLFCFVNLIVIYTGGIIAYEYKIFSLKIFLMMIASILIIFMEFVKYKKIKKIIFTQEKSIYSFLLFIKKLNFIQVIIMVIVYMMGSMQ